MVADARRDELGWMAGWCMAGAWLQCPETQ